MNEPGKIETQEQLPNDSGLRCPACEYNLTGVAEDRCPECGAGFDPAELQWSLAFGPMPIPVLDDENRPLIVNVARMCVRTWFRPGRVGASFPSRYKSRSAASYRRIVLTAALLLSASSIQTAVKLRQETGFLLVAVLGIVAGVFLTEWTITILMTALLVPLRPQEIARLPSGTLDNYHGLVTLFRSYLILTIGTATVLPQILSSVVSIYVDWGALWAVIPVWWWAALACAIIRLPVRASGKLICILLIPVVTAGSILLTIMMVGPVLMK